MNELAEVAERAVGSPVAPPPPIEVLGARADRRRHVARRRRRSGIAATTALLALAVVVVVRPGLDESSLSVVGPTPERTASSTTTGEPNDVVPAITDRSLYSDPAPTSDGMVLTPAGPYVAGQEVTVRVDDPRGRWDPNGAARQSAVIDGSAEICDIRTPIYLWQKVVLRADVLGPDGLIPCRAPSVDCRIVVGFEDTLAAVGSAPIEIIGDDPPSATLAVQPAEPLAASGSIDVRIDGVAPRPESEAMVAQLPVDQRSQWRQLNPTICRFRLPDEYGYGLNPFDCGGFWPGERTGLTLEAGETSSSGTVELDRVFFGSGGWQDCGANGCVLAMRRNYVSSLGEQATMGGTDELAVVPLRFDPTGTPRALPTLSIDGAGPFARDAEVTVRGTGFPVGSEPALGSCVPDGKTSFYGAPQPQNCVYSADGDVEVAPDGSLVATTRLSCWAPDRRCLLTWIPGDGSPPYATAPFELLE